MLGLVVPGVLHIPLVFVNGGAKHEVLPLKVCSFLWLWPTQSEVIRDIWKKKCTNQSNPQTWSILSWSISSSLVPLFIIKPMGRSFSTPGNEPLWGWFSGSRDLDQDLSCSHYIIIVSQVWDPETKTLLFNSMARNARAPTCTKRQLLVKLRGPRRLAKSVVLQPPEGLNMQQFNGIVFDDWPKWVEPGNSPE